MNPIRKFTNAEIIAILDDAISVYPNSRYYEVWALLHTKGLYKQYLNYYLNVSPDDKIKSRMNTLRELQQTKLVDGLLNKRSDVSETGAMFILRCKYGFIEQDKKERLDIERQKLEQATNVLDTLGQALNVNFTIAPHRTDEEINRLIEE